MAQIRIDSLRKEFGSFTAVQGSSFTVEDGEFFMLLGPSGCGKTTTLRMMAGLELPDLRRDLHRRRGGRAEARQPARHRLRLPDVCALPAHERAQEHRLPLRQRRASRAPRSARASLEVARLLGIEPHPRHRPVGGLSGGDRQRVALGRAIVRRPKAFFMDEPLGALDAEFREHMAEELRALHDRIGATTVYVTHDQLEAMQMGDKIVVMNHGVIEQFGMPQDIYDWPATHVRRRLHRLAADELPPLRWRRSAAAPTASRLDGAEIAVPVQRDGAARRARPRRPPRARPPSTTPRRLRGTGGRCRVSRHHSDRHAPRPPPATSRPASPPTGRSAPARPSGSASMPRTVTIFEKAQGRALRSAGNERVLHG